MDDQISLFKTKKKEKISGYYIYNNEMKTRKKINDLPEFYPKLPNKKYEIIYADPPWHYGGKMQFDKSGKIKNNKKWDKKIFISAANFKYPTVKTKELMNIPIQKITSDDCLLFLWTTNPHLEQSIALGNAWGFKYRTVGFVWNKMVHNPGQYTMSYCEQCLIFKKGRIPTPRGARNVKQLINIPRTTHSKKPIEVLNGINEMFPTQNKIELFARSKNKGWDSWGLDVEEVFK